MTKRAIFLAGYLIFWFVYFLFFKALFLIYHSGLAEELEPIMVAGIFLHGSMMDLSASAYLSIIPFLLVTLSTLVPPGKWLYKTLLTYTTIIVILMTILCSTDLELFRIWGYRLDSTPLQYLNTPKEMLISVGVSPVLFLVILNAIINLFFCFAYRQILHPIIQFFSPPHKNKTPAYAIATLSLFLLMRGGLGAEPLQLEHVYFSSRLFANQAAVNVPWNFFHSLIQSRNHIENPYVFMSTPAADSIIQSLHPAKQAETPLLLKSPRPNIILIIWESLTAKAVEDLGGIAGVTPHFQKLSREGILFKRVFASGDRSDKGLVSILSGYPALPGKSILSQPEKSAALPTLASTLRNTGYATSFYYGGNLEFAKLKSYLLASGFDKLTGLESFKEDQQKAKWGVHDEEVFNKVLSNIRTESLRRPFFKTIFTLSSHEPFDIPTAPAFKGEDVASLFLSSLFYTDSVIGRFLEKAKDQEWYHNTLVIIIADHGHTYPGGSQLFEPAKFHIPMLWLGGALKTQPQVVEATMSQTDLAATLLSQLSVSDQEYKWSKNIFHPDTPHFAPYFFNNGLGFVTDSSYLAFDTIGRQLIEQQPPANRTLLLIAKAYLQQCYGDYVNK